MTNQERADQIGIARSKLQKWKADGVDIFDDDAVRDKIASLQKLPPNLNDQFIPRISAPDIDPAELDIEAIIKSLGEADDKNTAQTIKLKIDGLFNAYKLREAAGKYVSRSTVEEALIRIGAAVKAAIMRMEADLPPMLDGMEPASMQTVIKGKVDEVLLTLSEETSKIWTDNESPS